MNKLAPLQKLKVSVSLSNGGYLCDLEKKHGTIKKRVPEIADLVIFLLSIKMLGAWYLTINMVPESPQCTLSCFFHSDKTPPFPKPENIAEERIRFKLSELLGLKKKEVRKYILKKSFELTLRIIKPLKQKKERTT